MDFIFANEDLEKLYYDASAKTGLGPAVDKGFRKVMGFISAAENELDLRSYKGLHYHKLSGDRAHQHGLDINDKYRLIVERDDNQDRITIVVIEICDYH
jgi:toxin HigB-1